MSERRRAEIGPPEFLQLAGHPLRWRLLGELARSDRTVHELTGLVGEAQNLVSYHLGKLRDGAIVSARRSSADGRDSYYTVDLEQVGALMSSTARALHPGLGTMSGPPDELARPTTRVLFLCTGNSARSQMAEALLRHRSGGSAHVASAGSHPKPTHPDAVRVMRDEYGIDIAHQTSKHVDSLVDERFDWVITLCDKVREICPEFPGAPEAIHWSIADPSANQAGRATFVDTAAELDSRIRFLLAVLSDDTSGT